MRWRKSFRHSTVVVALLVLCFLDLLTGSARACRCRSLPPPPLEALEESDFVFSGTVLSMELGVSENVATFSVSKVWKGDVGPTALVTTPAHSCGILFDPPVPFLVYATDNGEGEIYTHLCTRTEFYRYWEANELGEPLVSYAPFRRGDTNEDGDADLSDAVRILNYLFLGGDAPSCLDAADVDDNGALEVTDAISLLGYLFTGGSAPSPPFDACGIDPGDDDLGCLSYILCLTGI